MSDEKVTNIREAYNPEPLSQAISQVQTLNKGLNPQPLAQAVQQVAQGTGAAPQSPSASNTQSPAPINSQSPADSQTGTQ